MQKHTPGPWRMERIGGDWRNQREKGMALRVDAPEANGPKEWSVAVVYNKPVWEQAEANARLIAAAPALLEALEEVLREYSAHSINPRTMDKAAQVIAAARGDDK